MAQQAGPDLLRNIPLEDRKLIKILGSEETPVSSKRRAIRKLFTNAEKRKREPKHQTATGEWIN